MFRVTNQSSLVSLQLNALHYIIYLIEGIKKNERFVAIVDIFYHFFNFFPIFQTIISQEESEEGM